MSAVRIGVAGYGYIGRSIVERIEDSGERFETTFVYNRSPEALADIDPALRLDDLERARARRPDLIVECAHPGITERFGGVVMAQRQAWDRWPISRWWPWRSRLA